MSNHLKFFNTKSRSVEEFSATGPVKIYTCGPTVYDFAHIGNFTAYVYWDILVRTLEANGYKTRRVMNITDVGHLASDADEGQDKLEKAASRDNKTVWEIAEYFTDDFLKHFAALNCREPVIRDKASGEYRDGLAKATDYIFEGQELIKKLITKGVIYSTSDGLYFDTAQFPRYADFARLDLKGMEAGARIGENAEKRNPSDFAVWKFIKKDENHAMQWPLPPEIQSAVEIDKSDLLLNDSGAILGYPGWHLECSAVIHSELGEPIDIHCGGIDHIPVHHTNEIAQSEVAFDRELSHFWLHNNFITVEGEKMAKSAGNFLTFADILEKGFDYMDFRMWVLQGHYESERNFSWENLEHARNLRHKWLAVAALRHQGQKDQQIALFGDVKQSILHHFSNNLSTSGGIMEIDKVMERIHQGTIDRADFDFASFLEFVDDLTGLNLLGSTPDIPKEAYDIIKQRLEARKNKDWAESDRLRSEIQEKHNLTLTDTTHKTFWSYSI